MSKHCETCRFWHKDGDKYGQCRRYAPRPSTEDATWQLTNADDWCGEHETKPIPGERPFHRSDLGPA